MFMKNFKASFTAHGGHDGPATIQALSPKIAELKTAGLTGKQAGLVLAEQSKLTRALEAERELNA